MTDPSSSDLWDLGVYTSEEYVKYSNGIPANGISVSKNVNKITNGNATVPADDYVLGFHCNNSGETCQITIHLSATN